MRNVIIQGAVRTPIGDIGGSLAKLSAVALGTAASAESLRRAGLSANQVNEVIFGNVLQAGQGQNPARQVALAAGVPQSVAAFTVNMVCGSGLKAIDLAWQRILLGRADAVLAGGFESMSQAPYLLPALREGARLGNAVAVDSVVYDGLTDVFGQVHMGVTAETIAKEFGVTREAQDRFAYESQQKYFAASEAGHLAEEIVPLKIKDRKGEITVSADEHPRPQTTFEKLSALRPAFQANGTVTAGNASGINDGGASMLVLAEDSPAASSSAPSVRIRDIVSVGCAPATMGMGPVGAVRKLLADNKLSSGDIELWELNEAFAAQSLAVMRELGLDPVRVNVNGGAIALGHPIGASGARVVVSLIHQMKRQSAGLGVASLCIGGGMGIAILLENR
jgi:acetyl-CoA C-acetyltransferase